MENNQNNQNEQKNILELFIPGRPVSIRSIHSILMIVESAVVWSVIAILMNEREKCYDIYKKPGGREEQQVCDKLDEIDNQLRPLKNSYKKYLTEKYEKLFLNAVDEAKNSVISSQMAYSIN